MQKQRALKLKTHFYLMLIMICSFIGVGFVSGAEIYEFFVRFGNLCYVGILVFFVLCFLLSYKILRQTNNRQILNYNALKTEKTNISNLNVKLQEKFNFKQKNTFSIKKLLKKFIVFLNVLFISGAMFSGLKNLLLNLFFNNYLVLLFICFVFTFFIVLIGVKGLEKIDVFVVAFVFIILVCFISDSSFNFITYSETPDFVQSSLFGRSYNSFAGALFLCVVFSGLYVFMNILQFQPIVAQSGLTFSRRKAIIFSLIFSLILCLFLLFFSIFLNCNKGLGEESMPFLTFFLGKGGVMAKIFPFGLLICLLTTLITCLIGVRNSFIAGLKLSNFGATSLALVLAILLSILPFNFFVSIIYPVLGVLNLFTFVFL